MIIYIIIIIIILAYYYYYKINENLESNEIIKLKQEYSDYKINKLECKKSQKKICKINNNEYKIHNVKPNNINEVNCNAYNNIPIFCNTLGLDSNNKISSNSKETCTLTPEMSNENIIKEIDPNNPVPVCNTYKCKPGYIKAGNFCANIEDNTKCALDPLRTNGYELCEKKSLYKKYENINYKNNTNIIKTINNSTINECANKCNKNILYYGTEDDFKKKLTVFTFTKYNLLNFNKINKVDLKFFKYNNIFYKYEIEPNKYINDIIFWYEQKDNFNSDKLNSLKYIRFPDPNNSLFLYVAISNKFEIKKVTNQDISLISEEIRNLELLNWNCAELDDQNYICIRLKNEFTDLCDDIVDDDKKPPNKICKTGISKCPKGLKKYCTINGSVNNKIYEDGEIAEINGNKKIINCNVKDSMNLTFCEIENNKLDNLRNIDDNEYLSKHFSKPLNNLSLKSCFLGNPIISKLPVRRDRELNEYTGKFIGKETIYTMPKCKSEDRCYIYNETQTPENLPDPSIKPCYVKNDCQYFTFDKKNNKCILSNELNISENERDKSIYMEDEIDTYMKLPLNYQEMKQSDIIGDPLMTLSNNNTIEQCARICNIYPNCNTFTYGTGLKNGGRCELRNVDNKNIDENSQKFVDNATTSVFTKKYKYQVYNYDDNGNKTVINNSDLVNNFNDYKKHSPNKIGNLCTLNEELPNKIIKKEIKNKNKKHEKKLLDKYKMTNKYKKVIKNKVKETVMKDTVKFIMDKKAIIVWDNIDILCDEVYFELLANRRLILPYIQIFIEYNNEIINIFGENSNGIKYISNSNDASVITPFKVEESTYGKKEKNIQLENKAYINILKNNGFYIFDNKIKNKISNSHAVADLNICYISKLTQNPTVKFKFLDGSISNYNLQKSVLIKKIVVFNKAFGNLDELLPLKIGLKNSFHINDTKFVIKKSWDEELIESSNLPKIPDKINITSYKDLKEYTKINNKTQLASIKNLGDVTKIREWVDLNNTGNNDVYCSFESDNMLRCIDKNKDWDKSKITYNIDKYDPSEFPNTHYFDKINNDLHFCRCARDNENSDSYYTNVYCYNMNPNLDNSARGSDTLQTNKPSNCQYYTGPMLKSFKLNASFLDKKKCVNYKDNNSENKYLGIEKNTIDASFSTNKFTYFFKNTKLNNKNIVIYKILNNKKNQHYKIFNDITFPGLDDIFYSKLDACYCIQNIVYFFSDDKVSKFNLIKNNVEIFIDGETIKTIEDFYFSKSSKILDLKQFFKDITAVVAIDNNTLLFFSGTKYIEYNSKLKKGEIQIFNLNLDMKDNIKTTNINSIFKMNETLYIINKNLHCKYNLITKMQDYSYGWKKNNISNTELNPYNENNIWEYNINLLV